MTPTRTEGKRFGSEPIAELELLRILTTTAAKPGVGGFVGVSAKTEKLVNDKDKLSIVNRIILIGPPGVPFICDSSSLDNVEDKFNENIPHPRHGGAGGSCSPFKFLL